MTDTLDATDRLLGLADTLAGSWGARARATTSAGQERAVLRLFGVSGLDRAGRWLITAGQNDNRIAVLKIDPASGRLSASCAKPSSSQTL